eukprot:513551_1
MLDHIYHGSFKFTTALRMKKILLDISVNGTYVNGKRIHHAEHVLCNGDMIEHLQMIYIDGDYYMDRDTNMKEAQTITLNKMDSKYHLRTDDELIVYDDQYTIESISNSIMRVTHVPPCIANTIGTFVGDTLETICYIISCNRPICKKQRLPRCDTMCGSPLI